MKPVKLILGNALAARGAANSCNLQQLAAQVLWLSNCRLLLSSVFKGKRYKWRLLILSAARWDFSANRRLPFAATSSPAQYK